jgi:phosphonatase-like hydrolase
VTLPALVVFDLAGTSVEDDGQVPAAFAEALLEHGIRVTADQVRAVRGASKREALESFIPDGAHRPERLDAAYASFRARLARNYRAGVRAVVGAATAISALRMRGVRVAFNTGFDRDTTALLLDSLQWSRGVVDAVVCGDDVPAGRPAPFLIYRAMELTGTQAARAVANVGDTRLDLEAGFNAGVGWNIGVLSGAHDRAAMTAAPHTHLVTSVADLSTVWRDD